MIPRFGLAFLIVVTTSAAASAQNPDPKAAPAPNRRLLMADYSTGRVAILAADGKIEWEHKIRDLHDLHLLPTGNILFQTSFRQIVEVDPKTATIVWKYDADQANGNAGKAVEVHAFQRLADGVTMIAESGPSRIIEVDAAGKLLREVKLKVARSDAHRDTRLVRKLDTGNYLVAHEGEGAVREYDGTGKVVWDYPVPMFGQKSKDGHGPEGFGNSCFAALRLKNGNTLISTGNGHSVIEVTPSKDVVWSLKQGDVKGIQLGWVTTLQVLANGNIVIGNCHAGKNNPQLIEVNRDKEVVWTFRDFDRFGNSVSNSQVIEK